MNLVDPQVTQLLQALAALGLSRRLFPCRHYAGHVQGRRRYFPRKLPLALEEDRATFVYVDPGRDTDSELLSWRAEHAPIWAGLRARERPVHVVAVARDDLRRERAGKILRRWASPDPEAVFHFRWAGPEKSQDVKHTWGSVFHSRSGEFHKPPFRHLVEPLRVVPVLPEEARPDGESG